MKQKLYVVLLSLFCCCLTGCALLQLPFQVAGGVANGLINLAKHIPMPPPGVFF